MILPRELTAKPMEQHRQPRNQLMNIWKLGTAYYRGGFHINGKRMSYLTNCTRTADNIFMECF